MSARLLWLDRLGIGVSLACAVHCAGLAALALAPAIAREAEALHAWEAPLLWSALVLGALSLVPSYRAHGHVLPLALFGAGAMSVLLGHSLPGLEIALTLPGVVVVASAHALNLRHCASHAAAARH